MAVVARKEYIGKPRDSVEKFNGSQLVYVSWDHHLIFSAPFLLFVSPDMKFRDLQDQILSALIQADPHAADVDWDKVKWFKANTPWVPEMNLSVKENAITHKEQLRFKTDHTISAAGL